MRLKLKCDWCGKEFERLECQTKGKKHLFCSRECLANFSSKAKNPKSYETLKDYSNISQALTALNRKLNPTRMTLETRQKIRNTLLNTGAGITYTKYYGTHEHRLVAEHLLSRKLTPSEIVHHRDGNKRNNVPENIVVFKNQSEHAKHHAELNWFLREITKIEGGDAE